jgi:DNA ligase-1
MKFAVVVDAFERLEGITSRTQMTVILVELFKKTPPNVIDKVIYMMLGKLWPDWKGMPELGIGEKMLVKAISIATHVPEKNVENLLKKFGDPGKVAEYLKSSKSSGPGLMAFLGGVKREVLTVDKVYNTLVRVALAQGEGSRDIKLNCLLG